MAGMESQITIDVCSDENTSPRYDIKLSNLVISSPSSCSGVFVVDEQENIINRVPAYERLVTGKKRSYPHEVTIL